MSNIPQISEKVKRIKESDQDFEWYPTTRQMIQCVFDDVCERKLPFGNFDRLMDIGAGDGNLFRTWDILIDEKFPIDSYGQRPSRMNNVPCNYFAIEKSKILMEYLPNNVVIIGTEFHQQTLIDKNMSVVFCNPPYSEFEEWAEKCILESQTLLLYLVIPERWRESSPIKKSIAQRKATGTVIYEGDFSDAPRAARARINIIRIDMRGQNHSEYGYSQHAQTDPFTIWFEKEFKTFSKNTQYFSSDSGTFKIKLEMVTGSNLIERLEKCM